MARARLLKPGFFTNDHLATLPLAARVLFQGLWCIADREGRLEDRPARIKIEVLPYDDVDVDAMLDLLMVGGYVERYELDGLRLIQIQKFLKHQSPHQREPASILPAPDTPGASPVLALDRRGAGPAVAVAVAVAETESIAVAVADPSTTAAPIPRDALHRCILAYDQLMGSAASGQTEQRHMREWLEAMAPTAYDGAEWLEEACEEAALSGVKNLKYVLAICRRWQRDGFKADKRSGTTNGAIAADPERAEYLAAKSRGTNSGAGLVVFTASDEAIIRRYEAKERASA